MKTDEIKINLRRYYNQEAEHRNSGKKQYWKISQREAFLNLALGENKKSLLEIGAGAGHDSEFFMKQGLEVTAIDLSGEMVRICKEKSIDAYEHDFYNLDKLNKTFDCVWSMNSLLHVPKNDLEMVLTNISSVLNEKGIFFMGVYGGKDSESYVVNELSDAPRFFSSYSEDNIKNVLGRVFDIISYNQFDVDRATDFQAIVMRKKQSN